MGNSADGEPSVVEQLRKVLVEWPDKEEVQKLLESIESQVGFGWKLTSC